MRRRSFLKASGIAGSVAAASPLLLLPAEGCAAPRKGVHGIGKHEIATDLVIAGGGLGGVACALAALDYYRRNYPLTPEAMARPELNPGKGAVSRLCAEPRAGVAVLLGMLAPWLSSGKLTLLLETRIIGADAEVDRVRKTIVNWPQNDYHITNGCYRLHPVEWNIGESVGMLVAYALQKKITPAAVRDTPAHLADFQKLLTSRGVELSWPT